MEDESEESPLTLSETWRALREWNTRFLTAYEGVEGNDEQAVIEDLRAALTELRELELRAATMPRLRPAAAAWRAVDTIVELDREIVAHYFAALTASTPQEAASEGGLGQRTIDRAVALLDRLDAYAEQSDRLNETDLADEWGDVVAGAQGAFFLAQANSIQSFDQLGVDLYERITGSRDCPTGFGIRLQMVAIIAETQFDPKRFWETTARIYRIAIGAKTPLERLIQSQSWREDMLAVTAEARDAGFELSAVAVVENRRRQIRAAIRFGHITAERLAPPHLATIVALTRGRGYAEERKKNIGVLLNEVRQAGLGDVVEGIDLAFRHGDAHKLYSITDEGVRFTADRREYDFLTDEELIDRVLLGFESIIALNVGISAALTESGLELLELEALTHLEVPETDRIRLTLALNGWTSVDVELSGLNVRAAGRRPGPSPLGIMATLVPHLPADVEYLVLEAHDDDGRVHVAEGPVEPFRRFAATAGDPFQHHVALIEAVASWRVDAECPFSPELVRKLLAINALQTFDPDQPPGEAIRKLRTLLDAAGRLEFLDIRAALGDVLRLRRESHSARPVTVDVADLSGRLSSWASAEVSPPCTHW